MKRLFSARSLAVAALALGAVGVASAAHARSDVILSIGVNAPYGYVQPAPVYVEPQPVYVQPRPVYVQPQTMYYGHDRRLFAAAPTATADRDGIPNMYDRDSRYYDARWPTAVAAGSATRTATACRTATTARPTTRTATDANPGACAWVAHCGPMSSVPNPGLRASWMIAQPERLASRGV